MGLWLLWCWASPVAAQSVSEAGLRLNDAVRLALEKGYALRLQQEQLQISEGQVLAAAGTFDPSLDASFQGGRSETPQLTTDGTTLLRNGSGTYRVGLSKQYRSGLLVSPGVQLTRTDFLTSSVAPQINTRASLLMRLPLLRGRGANLAAAGEAAARTAFMADEWNLQHTASESVLQVAVAYWGYVAAFKSAHIFQASEERARRLLQETEALVAGGERPAAELDQLGASLADRISARINAEQRLFEARQQLGLAMGLPFEQFDTLPMPTEDFPPLDAVQNVPLTPEAFYRQALDQRADLRSATRQEEASHILLAAFQNETRPQLDLQLDLGYTGLSQGGRITEYLPPVGQNDRSGTNAFVALVYSLPAGNNRAQGQHLQQEAAYRQAHLVAEDLTRQIRSGVAVVVAALQRSIEEVQRSHEAVQLYQTAVAHEQKKVQLGMATLFDVTLVEERLTSALLTEVSARSRYAQALVRLRHETGTLIASSPETGLRFQSLTTLPTPR
jgi:outer membrane protein TolC